MQDIINEVDMDGSEKVKLFIITYQYLEFICKVEWPEFAAVLAAKLKAEDEEENYYKETFRVFSKDEEGCITADEMKFVLSQICSMEVIMIISLAVTVTHFSPT